MTIPRNLSALAPNVSASGVNAVSGGGTGAASLTANNVLLGNGTSAVQFVAPGTNGNVLTSNGTTWTSAALSVSTSGGATTTAPMSANITLTSSSNRVQTLAPDSNGRTITLPNATTISAAGGPIFTLINTVQEYPIAILDSSGTNVGWVVADYPSNVYLTSTASATDNWVIRTGNPSADGGVYLYDAPFFGDAGVVPTRTYGIGLNKDLFVGQSRFTGSNYLFSYLSSASSYGYASASSSSNSMQNSPGGLYAHCYVSPTMVFTVYQTPTNFFCYVTSINATTGAFTNGAELSLGSTNNQGWPVCSALNSSTVMVMFNGSNPSNFAALYVISISGTTCTAGSVLGSSSNQVGANISNTAGIAWLSSTKAHVSSSSNTLYSVSVSGTTPTRAGSANASGSIYGLVPASSTQSMVFYNGGSGSIVAAIASDAAGTITFGSAISIGLPTSGFYNYSVNRINTNVALVIASVGAGSYTAGSRFVLVRNLSGTPTVIGRGTLPASTPIAKLEAASGATLVPIFQNYGSQTSNFTLMFQKAMVTGGV